MGRTSLALTVFSLLLSIASGARCDTPQRYLVRTEVGDRDDLADLLGYGVNVVQDMGSYILVRGGISDVAFLESAGFTAEIIDSDWGHCDHYIVPLGRCPRPSVMGKVVYQDSDVAIVRSMRPYSSREIGCDAKKVRHRPIKLRQSPLRVGSPLPDTLPDPLIQAMVDSVSSDTVENYLRTLEGMGTRYSFAPGCSVAAEYIKSRFESAGLSAELQAYEMPASVNEVLCVTNSVMWAVDEVGGIYKSEDGGATWLEKYSHSQSLLGIFFLDSLAGWAVGGDTVLHTTDGGENWFAQASPGALGLIRCAFWNASLGWATGVTPDTTAAIYRTTDGGNNWAAADLLFEGDFLGISMVDSLEVWIAGRDVDAGSGVLYSTTNGGVGWIRQLDTTGIHFMGVSFSDSQRGWAAGGDVSNGWAVMMATDDGGVNWQPQVTGGWFLGDVDFVDSVNGWCVGYNTAKYTTDGGLTWLHQFPPVPVFCMSIDMRDTLHGLFGGDVGTICYTQNAGANWLLSNTGGVYSWYNVEAEHPGVDLPDEITIICGHHDSRSEDPMYNAPGADDNASGVSGVLESARILSPYQFRRTIRFVTFSGEEQGLLGSEAYARKADSLGENIVGVVNLDMIGYLDDADHDLEIVSNLQSEWMVDTMLRFSSAYVPALVPHKVVDPGRVSSDHASFWDTGYPAIEQIENAGTQWNPYYHSTGDTVGTLDIPFVTEMVRLGLASVAEIAEPYAAGVQESFRSRSPGAELSLGVITANPFSGQVGLHTVNTSRDSAVLEIFDSAGRLVRRFEPVAGAETDVVWFALTDAGALAPTGVYFARFGSGTRAVSQKLILLQ